MKKLKMEDKVTYMRIGLNLAGIACDDGSAEIIVRTYEMIAKKGGSFSLSDGCDIEMAVRGKLNENRLSMEKSLKSVMEELTDEVKKLRESNPLPSYNL